MALRLPKHDYHDIERVIELDFVRATEAAALNSLRWLGRGDKEAAAEVPVVRKALDALREIRGQALAMLSGAGDVNSLAASIEQTSSARRRELERTLRILTDVRHSVKQATQEVAVLNDTAVDINRFVETVSRIAEQTNLLALNATIEAARAGELGRGFAVVADAVRRGLRGAREHSRELRGTRAADVRHHRDCVSDGQDARGIAAALPRSFRGRELRTRTRVA